ncbi:MAG TPA: Crp/Fnr family transcriptional regulator [Pirellulaceae bacterium]|nr:Crp/Fnr family transcriptional regulator [Pirellulaceae bacterium]
MNQADLRSILQALPFSAGLSDATAEKLAGLVSLQQFSGGSVIFAEGAANPSVYLIVEGEVALEMCVPARGCTRILTLGPGELLAWSSLLGGGRMTAGALALTDVRMLVAPAKAIGDLCAADRDVGFEFFRSVAVALSKRLVATRLQLLDLYGDAAPQPTAAGIS